MSRAIPVFEREQRKTYELQRGNPRRRMLNKHWKQDPPKSDDKHPNLFSMITKNNYIIDVIINLGPYTHQKRNAGNILSKKDI